MPATKDAAALHVLPEICPNCGEDVIGMFCPSCGQKHRTPYHYSIRHFIRHAFSELTDFDSRVLKSFACLLFRPGTLTAAWRDGHEERFVKPMRLFLIVNLIYFISLNFFPMNSIFVPLDSHYDGEIYSNIIRPLIDAKIHTSRLSHKEFAKKFDGVSMEQAKALVIIMVPFLALILALLYFRRREYFVEHLVFSLHFYAFFFLFISLGIGAWVFIVESLFPFFGLNGYKFLGDEAFTLISGLAFFSYLLIAIKKVYGGAWWANSIRSLLLCYSILWILWLYRFILFFATLYTMNLKV